MIREKHWTLYGDVKIIRVYCNDCKGMTIVLNNIKQCCDKLVGNKKTNKLERMSTCSNYKCKPSIERQKEILKQQDNKCLYCNRSFGTLYTRKGKILFTKTHFDHLVPYSYQQSNKNLNFVAACNICNGIKSNLVFDTVEESL